MADAGTTRVEVHDFRDGFLPYVGAEVKDVFEALKARVDPQVVFTHTGYDFHQDHRLACELSWNTFRRHLILEYEIPKVDGDLGRPNLYVPLSVDVVDQKLALLEEHFPSQSEKHWYDRETVPRTHAAAGDGSRRADAVRGGVHLPQDRDGRLVERRVERLVVFAALSTSV